MELTLTVLVLTIQTNKRITYDAFKENGEGKKKSQCLNLSSEDNRTNFEARGSTIDPLPPIPITQRISPLHLPVGRATKIRSKETNPTELRLSLSLSLSVSLLPLPFVYINPRSHSRPVPFVSN